MRFGQIVIGPAGSGKSTYCSTIVQHAAAENRIIRVVNLDPAAEEFDYEPLADIRELIHLDDVMEDEELRYGPNGGLVFCLEFLMSNPDWLQEQLGDDVDDYILFDCPGQIELYTHVPVIRNLVTFLENLDFRIATVFLLDSHFMIETSKFMSGVMTALAAMVNLETPQVNILSKMDLLNPAAFKNISRFTELETDRLLMDEIEGDKWGDKHRRLTEAIAKLIEDYSIVKFLPFNMKDEENIGEILMTIDNCIQFGEDADVKVKDFDPEENENFDTEEYDDNDGN